jgi:hypothetical protein
MGHYALLETGGVKCVPIPAHSPNCNPHAERFVKTLRTECLNHFVIFGERHLRHLVKEFMTHYLRERYHQGIDSQIIWPKALPSNDNATSGAIGRVSRSRRTAKLLLPQGGVRRGDGFSDTAPFNLT